MAENTPKPRRFWRPRFGLRSLFVMVTVAAMGCAWVWTFDDLMFGDA